MATPRLPFLWPFLLRGSNEFTAISVKAAAHHSVRHQALHQTVRKRQLDGLAKQRYGAANEPYPHLGGNGAMARQRQGSRQQGVELDLKPLPKIGDQLQRKGEEEVEHDQIMAQQGGEDVSKTATGKPATMSDKVLIGSRMMADPMMDSVESVQRQDKPPAPPDPPPDGRTDTLLHSVPGAATRTNVTEEPHPEETGGFTEEHAPSVVQPPHMDTPRYVHHFDTYGLVKRLTDGGWQEDQAVTMMKVTRLMLAENMELARDALVSKSQIENESYLFKAACSELKTEVTQRRKGEQEKMRTERTQLQHEVDILSQRLGQEAATLKDELKGMFDDRKLAVRGEQRDMESKIQQLNYKITVSLQADAKSDVEGLRWIMTRRVILTLLAVVVMVVGFLKLYSGKLQEAEAEAKRSSDGTKSHSPFLSTDELLTGNTKTVDPRTGEPYKPEEGERASGFVSLG